MNRLTTRDNEAVYTEASDWEVRYRLADYEDLGSVEELKRLKELFEDDKK